MEMKRYRENVGYEGGRVSTSNRPPRSIGVAVS